MNLSTELDRRDSLVLGSASWMASVSLTRLVLSDCLPIESSLSLEVSTLRVTTTQLEEELNSNSEYGKRLRDLRSLESRLSDLKADLVRQNAAEIQLREALVEVERSYVPLNTMFTTLQSEASALSRDVADLELQVSRQNDAVIGEREVLNAIVSQNLRLSSQERDLQVHLLSLTEREAELRYKQNSVRLPTVDVSAFTCPLPARRESASGESASAGEVELSTAVRQGKSFKQHRNAVTCLAFAMTRPLLATGGDDSLVYLMNTGTSEQLAPIKDTDASIMSVRFSPSDKLLLTACWDHAVRIYRVADTPHLVGNCKQHSDCVYDARFLSEDKFASCSRDQTIKIFDAKKMQLIQSITAPSSATSMCTIPEGSLVVTAHFDGALRIWDSREGAQPLEVKAHKRAAWFVDAVPGSSSQLISYGLEDKQIVVSDFRTKNLLAKMLHKSPVQREKIQLAFYGGSVFIGGQNGELFLYDLTSYKFRDSIAGQTANVFCVAAKNSFGLASGDQSGVVRLWLK
jgi:WD40 repeat protein